MFNTVGRQAAAVGSALKAPTLGGLSIVESFLKGVSGKDAPAGKPAQEPQKKVEFNDKKINRFFDHKGKVKDAQPLQIARPHLNRAMALDVLVTGNNELLAAHGGKFPAGHKLQIVLSQLGQTPLKIDLNPADIPKSVTEQAIKDIRQAEIGRKRVISAAGAAAGAAVRTAAGVAAREAAVEAEAAAKAAETAAGAEARAAAGAAAGTAAGVAEEAAKAAEAAAGAAVRTAAVAAAGAAAVVAEAAAKSAEAAAGAVVRTAAVAAAVVAKAAAKSAEAAAVAAAGAAARAAAGAEAKAVSTAAEKSIAKAGEDAKKQAEDKNPMPLLVQAMEAIMRIPAEINVNTNGTDGKLSFPGTASFRVQLVEA